MAVEKSFIPLNQRILGFSLLLCKKAQLPMPVNGHAKTHIDGADMLCEKLPLVVMQTP
jgi:hypothetical protein